MIETIKYYDKNAKEYFLKTKDIDMSYQRDIFVNYLQPKSKILDFGCGSGRDSKVFLEKGYQVTAIDGSQKLCDLASKYLGQEVKCMDFRGLNDYNQYNGIWACASLLHLEHKDLNYILRKMSYALRPNGIVYTCFKDGKDERYNADGRYYNDMDYQKMKTLLFLNKEFELEDFFTNETETVHWNNFYLRKRTKD